jgi:hypothetical protein
VRSVLCLLDPKLEKRRAAIHLESCIILQIGNTIGNTKFPPLSLPDLRSCNLGDLDTLLPLAGLYRSLHLIAEDLASGGTEVIYACDPKSSLGPSLYIIIGCSDFHYGLLVYW